MEPTIQCPATIRSKLSDEIAKLESTEVIEKKVTIKDEGVSDYKA